MGRGGTTQVYASHPVQPRCRDRTEPVRSGVSPGHLHLITPATAAPRAAKSCDTPLTISGRACRRPDRTLSMLSAPPHLRAGGLRGRSLRPPVSRSTGKQLAEAAAEWLRRGVSEGELRTALTAGLRSAYIRSAVGFLRHRLAAELPAEADPVTAPGERAGAAGPVVCRGPVTSLSAGRWRVNRTAAVAGPGVRAGRRNRRYRSRPGVRGRRR